MHQEREDLDILFRRTAPEIILKNIMQYKHSLDNFHLTANASEYSYITYDHYSRLNLPEYSIDEIKMRFQALEESIKEKQSDKIMLFKPLYLYADKVLTMCGEEPVCRLERILGWNSITKRLGQDILVTAWMAERDVKGLCDYVERKKFTWPAVLKTDDIRLKYIFHKGLAENHFHLHGSTQSFALSWACLMNHPMYIDSFFKENNNFNENLNSNISSGILDNPMKWEEKISYAVMIRALLFERCCGAIDRKTVWQKFCKFDQLSLNIYLNRYIESLREEYGAKFKQPDNYSVCLDYAAGNYLYNLDKDSPNRLLSGERSFLYHCFYLHFKSEFSPQESSLFYLYLSIKSNFRGEIVQVNGRSGFANFARYQDRKNQFFNIDEYRTEELRLSVCAAANENNIVSLEARIMPKATAEQMDEEISKIDNIVQFESSFDIKKLYYVIHFPKLKFKLEDPSKDYLMLPRNWETRENTEKKARELVKYLQCYNSSNENAKKKQKKFVTYLQYYNRDNDDEIMRVFGIDACSSEIGCRPETFATEFRYIRKYGIAISNNYKDTGQILRKIGITYHVGEDFLDIVDGLRAIDETLMFLEMEKGDRLGHAIALGIEPKQYYKDKRYDIYMTKQDYLDNLVWILYKSLEFGITINANYRSEIKKKAEELLLEIYFHEHSIIKRDSDICSAQQLLDFYYYSWKLRGDHPKLYRNTVYEEKKLLEYDLYYTCLKQNNIKDDYRNNKLIAQFYHLYHFDRKAKETGLKITCFRVKDQYIDLMEKFQEAMRHKVAEKGVIIECNPTSNVLIGTFKNYSKHPILSFNNFYLENTANKVNIQATINTDDIGVFDTSLENEYALLFSAISRERHKQHNYNDDAIYEYLDYLRENGIRASFMNRHMLADTPTTKVMGFFSQCH